MRDDTHLHIALSPEPSAPRQSQPEEAASSQYWKATSGYTYREMIRTRQDAGNPGYGQQEALLTKLMQTEQRALERPLDVLEFGCGFGRHAAYLASLEGVRYHGYDFSEAMMEPLRQAPPVGLEPVDERLFCGPDALAAVGDRTFDVVFTVSVLIHNPPERLPGLMESLGKLVRPGGLLCLVENQLVPFGVWENAWHQGCWLHPYAELTPAGWDMHHGGGLLATHDVYVFKRNASQGRRFFQLQSVEQPRDERREVTLESLNVQSLPRLRAWTEHAGEVLQAGNGLTGMQVSELTERLTVELKRSERRQRLLSLSDELVRLRAEPVVTARAPVDTPAPRYGHDTVAEAVVVDAPLDTTWAHVDPRLSRVVHLFHQEWYGIRAASGYAPGHKIGITANRALTAADHQRIAETCERLGARSIIFQGFSPNALEVMHMLRRVFGSTLKLCCVWHGSTAQFHFDFELETFSRLLALREQGLLDAVACVKPEMHLMSPLLFQKVLLNLPPRVAPADQRHRASPTRAAFVPTPNNWWKNFYSNVFVAASLPGMERVFVTSPFSARPELPLKASVINVGPLNRSELFNLIRETDVVLNVTLAECQPMTALEGLTHGVACLTGPLTLGALDEHPFQRLVQVAGTGSLGQIRSALERVVGLRERSPEEYAQMLEDYTQTLCAQAINHYLEFAQP
ncbi:class I SAM-dependent methyltransferase [Myxococcus xanthus]|uniref:class I SAM-dependent methyltransferase n=1 Tax=Myxococcus xanthus TaxID=34 RepID=UPI00112BA0E7|nr:class I SAM-dependent methyltransferase [Myxococcus xanthus]QDE84252.1 methyltransferase type 11 [Myxococcus xanthus]QDE98423.1 methyltransferase type 11 [Myxococcus xanthus]